VIPPEIHRVLTGLVGNALDAVASVDQGLIWISTASAAGGAEILVRDNGSGIPEEIRERVFEPFFTTKPTGSGTGLGLSLAYDIVVKAHGGGLTFETAEGAGTTFRVFLPT
jgi:signal transduction histidine kinase